MKLIHDNQEYEVDFFFGTDGVEHKERGDRPHVRTKCFRSFNCDECKFIEEKRPERKRTIGFHKDTDHEDFG